MPNAHKGSKRTISARVEPDDRHQNLHDLAKFNGTDFAGLMVMIGKGIPIKSPTDDRWKTSKATEVNEMIEVEIDESVYGEIEKKARERGFGSVDEYLTAIGSGFDFARGCMQPEKPGESPAT